MNNKLIALAVAAAITAPMAAQAAPTVYGIMQAEIAQTKNSAAATTDKSYVVDNKMGRFGFKGSEDLGEGLKAVYLMEFGIETSNNTTTGGGDIFDRETSLGLQIGSSHTIQIGNLKSPYKYSGGVKYDSFVATSMQAREGSTNVGASGGAMSSGVLGHGGFVENAVAYHGKFSPVKVQVLTTGFDDATSDSPTTAFSVSANVSSFEFGIAAITQDSCLASASTTDNCAANVAKTESTKLFGSWSKGQHTVRAQIETVDTTTAAGVASGSTDYQYLNYQFKMGKHLVDVVVGTKDQDSTAGNTDEDFTRLAYAYNFSKQTRAFAGVAASDVTNTAGTANDWDTFSVGMTVKF